jgi:ABC-type phosphate transport system permease subunit
VLPLLGPTLLLSLVSLGWSVPLGLLVASMLYRARRPALSVLVGTLRDLPTVAVAAVLGAVSGHGLLAGVAVGLVVLPEVALGAARALERSPSGALRAATALGISRHRFVFQILFPRIRGPIGATILRAWSRGVGEALIAQAALGSLSLSGSVLTTPAEARGPAAVLLLVAMVTPLIARRMESR